MQAASGKSCYRRSLRRFVGALRSTSDNRTECQLFSLVFSVLPLVKFSAPQATTTGCGFAELFRDSFLPVLSLTRSQNTLRESFPLHLYLFGGTIKTMKFQFDPAKNKTNIAKHGVDMVLVTEFEFDTAIEQTDDRMDYEETRWQALGFLNGRLHSLVYTERRKTIRVISLRRASRKEEKLYAKAQK